MINPVSIDAAKQAASTAMRKVRDSAAPTGEDFFNAAFALTRLEEISGLKLEKLFRWLATMKYGQQPLETPAT